MQNKIVVVGNGGSGKSTMSVKLGNLLNIPVYHLDKIAWKKNWERLPLEAFEERLNVIMKNEKWILDGWSYHQSLYDRLEKCDTIIFISSPLWKCYYYVLKRQVKYAFSQNPYYPDDTASLPMTFYILKAVTRVHFNYMPELLEWLKKFEHKTIRLGSFKEINEYLKKLSPGQIT